MPDFLPSKKELTNALAWFTAPVNDAIKKGKETAADIAEWLWVVLQGDFAEDQTTAQIVTGTVISMIPFVDQICDVRDICANATKIKEDSNNPWAWVGLILTLIGLFPVLGSLFKGVFKVILAPIDLPEGTILYRVLDPSSYDNSICWMRESEYKKLKSKADWRRYFEVFASWNHNGEMVKYRVPKGGLKVWEGPAASQTFKSSAGKVEKVNSKGEIFVLEGGGIQIVLDPKDLVHANISKREATPWGYDSGLIGEAKTSMVGVPRLEQNWYGDKK